MAILTIDKCFCEIKNGAIIKQGFVNGGFPITRIETLSDNKFNRDRMGYAGILDLSKYKDYILSDGDLLMSNVNSPKYVGRTVMYKAAKDEKIIHGKNLLRLKVYRDVVNPEYAELLFYSSSVLKQIKKITKVTANQASFSVADLKKIKVEIPSMSGQNDIVKKINKIKIILSIKKEILAKLDLLIKARFFEMFGNPLTNNLEWTTDSLENICDEIYGGRTPSKAHPEYYENGNILFVTAKDIKTDVLHDSLIKINQLGLCNSSARIVPANSVLIVIRSGILRHTLPVAINALPVTVNQDIKAFSPGKKVLPKFLAVQFKMLEKDILLGIRATTADNIEFSSLKKRKIIIPPLYLQNKFVNFVAQVDKSKFQVQKSLDQTQLLFDSLMQKFFK